MMNIKQYFLRVLTQPWLGITHCFGSKIVKWLLDFNTKDNRILPLIKPKLESSNECEY
jgi:hypothetical protein